MNRRDFLLSTSCISLIAVTGGVLIPCSDTKAADPFLGMLITTSLLKILGDVFNRIQYRQHLAYISELDERILSRSQMIGGSSQPVSQYFALEDNSLANQNFGVIDRTFGMGLTQGQAYVSGRYGSGFMSPNELALSDQYAEMTETSMIYPQSNQYFTPTTDQIQKIASRYPMSDYGVSGCRPYRDDHGNHIDVAMIRRANSKNVHSIFV